MLVEAGDLNKVRHWNEDPSTFSNRVSSITNASQAFLGGARLPCCVTLCACTVLKLGPRDRHMGACGRGADMSDRRDAGEFPSTIAGLVSGAVNVTHVELGLGWHIGRANHLLYAR